MNGKIKAVSGWQTDENYIRQMLQNKYPIELGRYMNPSVQSWPGQMDEVRFWNYARTEEQIKSSIRKVFRGIY